MRRPVYLRSGEVQCAAGDTLDDVAAACLRAAPTPPRYRTHTQLGLIDIPHFPLPAALPGLTGVLRLCGRVLGSARLAASALRDAGLYLGTSSGLLYEHEREYAEELASGIAVLPFRDAPVGKTAAQIADGLGIDGPRLTITTACSASANALLYAGWAIAEGQLDQVLVVATEFSNRLSLLGFHGLALMAPDRCRPFDAQRSGVVLGAGIGAVLLSSERGAAGWELLGGASLCDTSHPTSPAAGMIALTLRQALDDAGVNPGDIVALKAHGTGTPSNDLAEGLAIREVFGARLPPVTSIKPVFGHTLGACGVIETLAWLRCLDRGWIPPTSGFSEVDPAIGLVPLDKALAAPRGAVLLDFFGFGGNNCALVLRPC